MSEFQKLVAEVEGAKTNRRGRVTSPPARTFDLLLEHFAGGYENKPVAKIVVGLRVPSETESRSIETEAAKAAALTDGDTEAKVEAYQAALFTYYVARGLCSPHDVTAPHPLFELPEDMIPQALTPRAIKRIFDELERLHIEQSPLFPEATADDLLELSDRLAEPDPLAAAGTPQRLRALRYLRLALDTMRAE
jgi:hypothetical protein